jgi:DNA-binding CsgD family transcriptional regulator
MTTPADRMLAAIDRLAEVALDPTLWPAVMEDISRAAGATGAALLQSDNRTPDVPRTMGVNDLFDRYFRERWHVDDIRARAAPLLVTGEKLVITDYDSVTAEEMSHGPYYNELLRPFGLRWFAAVGFRAGPAQWALSIHRTTREGPFEGAELRMLEHLSPKLSEAATLSSAIGQAVLAGVGSTLDLCGQPALVLDRMGFVLSTNGAADRMFGNDIRPRNRLLHVMDPRARRELDALITWLRNSPESASVPCQAIIVRKTIGHPIVIRVLPVPPGARTPFLGARALLTLSDSYTSSHTCPELVARTYDLTPAEGKVAALIGDGATLGEVARRSGVAISTVRNQLKAVFAKTETHRQSELVALVSRLRIAQ